MITTDITGSPSTEKTDIEDQDIEVVDFDAATHSGRARFASVDEARAKLTDFYGQWFDEDETEAMVNQAITEASSGAGFI